MFIAKMYIKLRVIFYYHLLLSHCDSSPKKFIKRISKTIDLAGRDVLKAVQMSVNPKVIETPVVTAVAKNGIEVKARAKVTVRAKIERLVGGAREGIVTDIGAQLQTNKANADKRFSQAKAEQRRAMTIALEQETPSG